MAFFSETVYADDLYSYSIFDCTASDVAIQNFMEQFHVELQSWGGTNPAKETEHILASIEADSSGGHFRIFGVTFDSHLDMSSTVDELVCSAGWEMRTTLRTRRFYCSAELVQLL